MSEGNGQRQQIVLARDPKVVRQMLEQRREAIAAVLPKHLTADRMLRVTLGAIARTPQLQECTVNSLVRSVVVAAQLGLDPSGTLGEGYLVPYRNNNSGVKEAQFIPGYRGLISLARRTGEVEWIEARVVYEGDDFEYELGYEPVLRHKPPKLGSDRGQVLGAYAVARHVDGRKWLDVMSKDEIEKVRAVSRAATSEYGPWVNHWGEMARKTVARRLFKQLPLDDLDERDVAVIEAGDADADLPTLARPTMTDQEAAVHASLGPAMPPHTDPPDDRPAPPVPPAPDLPTVDEADWTEAVPADEETGQSSFADMIPPSAREQS